MATGTPYFAWVNPNETTFLVEHQRWDENVFSFTLAQEEGSFASLTVVVRRPNGGLLCPDRKIWAWFALDCGTELIKFFGRLVGIPTSIFEELVTLEFIARPRDYAGQKRDLANTLRVLPYYDEVVIDPQRRDDPDVVLEGYTAIWHIDRETHAVTVSDEIIGEDGLVEFDGLSADGKVLYEGLGLSLSSGPLASVEVNAEFEWTQSAAGGVDLTEYLTDNWPNEGFVGEGNISSFTFGAGDWPKNGAGIGDGWQVAEATSVEVYDLEVQSKTEGGKTIAKWWDGETTSIEKTQTTAFLKEIPPGSIEYPQIITQDSITVTYGDDGDGNRTVTAYNRSANLVPSVLPLHHVRPTLLAEYKSGRRCIERVSLTLFADVQSILTDPEDGEALRLDDIRSGNLSEAIGEGTDAYIPIVVPARRSYITTERGLESLEHLIALARAHLMKRARVVEITFAPPLVRMPEITLRKNVLLNEPRIGEALGKVIGYSLALNGSDGRINCEVRIGCTIGRGGSAVAAGGTPTYCSIDYCGADYQQFTGRTVLFDSSVGYQPPNADPNDDGINFQGLLTAEDVIEQALAVENPPATQRTAINGLLNEWDIGVFLPNQGIGFPETDRQALVTARSEAVNNALKEVETRATFRLKSMTREFVTDYEVEVTDLKIPTGIDLEVCDDTAEENVSLSPAAANLVLSSSAPTRTITLSSPVIIPASGNLLLSTTSPTREMTGPASISPASGNLILTTTAPTVDDGTEEDTDQQIIQTFLGQPISLISETTAQGGVYADWDALVTDYLDAQHTNFGSGNDAAFTGAVYDRPLINYVQYIRSGDSKYLTRGNSGVVGYRTDYLGPEGPDYGTQEPYNQFTSMALHYLLTGDNTTRIHLGNAGDNVAGRIDAGFITTAAPANSSRIMAHALTALIGATYIDAPSDGDGKTDGYLGGNNFHNIMDTYVDTILGTMAADGGHRFEQDTDYTYSYQMGLMDDALIHYYLIYADSTRKAAILAKLKKRHEFLWNVMLDQYNRPYGFIYLEGPNTVGGESQVQDYQPPGSADLACWTVGTLGFLYHVTGDETYRTRALQLMANSLQGDHSNTPPGAYLSTLSNNSAGSTQGVQHKILSELTRTTWRFLYYALATPLATPVVPVNSVLPAITGTASQGNAISCSTGTWSNSPSSFNYAWCKRPTAGGVNTVMQSSSTSTYTLQAGDVGFRVFCLVTATNGSGAGIIARAIETATVT